MRLLRKTVYGTRDVTLSVTSCNSDTSAGRTYEVLPYTGLAYNRNPL